MSLTENRLVKLVGTTFISLVLVSTLTFITLVVLEISGASSSLEKKIPKSFQSLHETDYYGEKQEFDPYSKFIIKHLHPYYIFSLPWMPDDIDKANNSFVSVGELGFRNSLLLERDKKALFLGGSTAFGQFSSSDKTTLASQLSIKTEYNFVNRNAPSWNSHQELIALTKYTEPYSLSLSFSFANDLSLFCYLRNYEYPIKDRIESFDILTSYFSDLKLTTKTSQRSFFLQDFAHRYFSESYNLVSALRRFFSYGVYFTKLIDLESQERSCFEHEDLIVKSFLANQKTMRELSSARGAFHIVAIQPMYTLHGISDENTRSFVFSNRKNSKEEIKFLTSVIKKIMEDPFCVQYCIDLTRPFLNRPNKDLVYNPLDSSSLETAIFADNVHLTDRGSMLVADQLAKFIEQLE